MNKLLFLTLLILTLWSNKILAQNDSIINKDFILVVNEKIESSVSGLKFFSYVEGRKVEYWVSYHAGDISFKEEAYNEIINQNIDSTFLEFYHYTYKGEKQVVRHFVIDFPIEWMNNTYFILYIYDMKRRIYKNLFKHSKEEEYVIEFESSRGAMKRVRKR